MTLPYPSPYRLSTWLIGLAVCFASVSSNAAVFEKKCDNGLTVLVKPDHRAPIVEIEVWYHVGSSDENTGKTGIAHVLEHMMFKGTKNHAPGEYPKIIAANGGRENAKTDDDFTAYYQTIAAKNLPVSLALEADRMQNLIIKPDEFKQELKVVQEERHMRLDDNPQLLTYERFRAAAHVNGPYHHLTIGWPSDIAHLTADDLQQWYHAWYSPNNATLVVVGDVEPEAVFQLAATYFGHIPQRALPARHPVGLLKPLGERRVVVNAQAQLPIVFLGYEVPTLTTQPNQNDAYALLVASQILGGSDSARLQTQLIRKQLLATSVGVDYNPFSKYDTLFVVDGIPTDPHKLPELEAALRQAVSQLQTTPVTEEELTRVKVNVVSNKLYAQDSISGAADFLGSLVSVGLPWQESMTYSDKVNAVTAQDVQRVAKQYFTPNNLTVAILAPTATAPAAVAKSTASSPSTSTSPQASTSTSPEASTTSASQQPSTSTSPQASASTSQQPSTAAQTQGAPDA